MATHQSAMAEQKFAAKGFVMLNLIQHPGNHAAGSPDGDGAPWTLNQVQGDEDASCGELEIQPKCCSKRNIFAFPREPLFRLPAPRVKIATG